MSITFIKLLICLTCMIMLSANELNKDIVTFLAEAEKHPKNIIKSTSNIKIFSVHDIENCTMDHKVLHNLNFEGKGNARAIKIVISSFTGTFDEDVKDVVFDLLERELKL